jgi:hypothetical protein
VLYPRGAPPTWIFDGQPMPVRVVPFDDEYVMLRDVQGVGHTRDSRVSARTPRERGKVDDEKLREVADVYMRAKGKGEPPTRAIEVEWEVARATANRWRRKAIEAGYLPG